MEQLMEIEIITPGTDCPIRITIPKGARLRFVERYAARQIGEVGAIKRQLACSAENALFAIFSTLGVR